MSAEEPQLVLVTGGSGYIAAECIRQLLTQTPHTVRTTVRTQAREQTVTSILTAGGTTSAQLERLTFAHADLNSDAGWSAAAAGCRYILHVASPFPPGPPKREDDLIAPARDGTLRVLRAAVAAGTVTRVVITGSFAAVGYFEGADTPGKLLSEEDWSDTTPGSGIPPYQKSKTLAERAAWEFVAGEDGILQEGGGRLELATVLPVGTFGPVWGDDFSTTVQLVKRMLDGTLPFAPDMQMGVVDVRDVAALHLKAMVLPEAAGERFLAVSGEPMTVLEMAAVLRGRLGRRARRAPTRPLPSWVLKVVGVVDKNVALILNEMGKRKRISNEKARRVLAWEPIPREDVLVATAESLLKLGIVKA